MPKFKLNKPKIQSNSRKRVFLNKKVTSSAKADVPEKLIAATVIEQKPIPSPATPEPSLTPPPIQADEPKPEITEIERLIEAQAQEVEDKANEYSHSLQEPLSPAVMDQPSVFDGVRDDEKWQLFEAQLNNEQKRANKLMHEMALMKQEFDQEKLRLEQHIRDLKRELHRTAQTENRGFFSISSDLKEAVNQIDKLVSTSNFKLTDINPELSTKTTDTAIPSVSPTPPTEPIKEVVKTPSEPTPQKEPEKAEKPKKDKKKLLITGGAAVAILIIGSTLTATQLAKPAVDDKLVEEYLQKNGQVQGATDGNTTPQAGVTTQDNSQNNFALEQTVWVEFKEPIFGVTLQYPQNVVKIAKSESNITFQRKEGYIFRIQKIETGLDLDAYWEQIKATNMSYKVEKTKFKEIDAIYLQLEELTKYPGDRYLVKVGEVIYDVWYATPSDSFDKDDIARAKKMLDTMIFSR